MCLSIHVVNGWFSRRGDGGLAVDPGPLSAPAGCRNEPGRGWVPARDAVGLRRLAALAQLGVLAGHVRVAARRRHGGHVEQAPRSGATAADERAALPLAGLARPGHDADQARRRLAVDTASSGTSASRPAATTGPTPAIDVSTSILRDSAASASAASWQSEQDFLQAVARKCSELEDGEDQQKQRESNVRIEVVKRLDLLRGSYGDELKSERVIQALQALAQEAEDSGQEHERDVLVKVIAKLEK